MVRPLTTRALRAFQRREQSRYGADVARAMDQLPALRRSAAAVLDQRRTPPRASTMETLFLSNGSPARCGKEILNNGVYLMNISNLYASIGAAGIALIVVALVAAYLCVNYLIYLSWSGHAFHRFLAAEEAGGARTDKSGDLLSRIYREAIRQAHTSPTDLRAELAFLSHKHFRKVNRAMTLLRLISVISPLLGLMGTVLGIVKVFRVIGIQTAVNPAMLATGIWEALITTIMGLAITIPVLCFVYFFRLQINGFKIELMEYVSRRCAPTLHRTPEEMS